VKNSFAWIALTGFSRAEHTRPKTLFRAKQDDSQNESCCGVEEPAALFPVFIEPI